MRFVCLFSLFIFFLHNFVITWNSKCVIFWNVEGRMCMELDFVAWNYISHGQIYDGVGMKTA